METVYDWVTMGVFAGLAILFLQRSVQQDERDSMLHYLPAAIGCALSNYLGNHGYPLISAGVLVAVLAYIAIVLKPFRDLKL